jgi:hypothetical protein
MKKLLALTLLLATTTIGISTLASGAASARDIRDHRGCSVFDPICATQPGPVVRPPHPLPPEVGIPPVVVIDPPIGPRPPIEPPHHNWPNGPDHGQWDDNQDEYGISCREGRSIVRHSGFRHVKSVDCSGNIYRYNATSRDGRVTVLVNMDGDIVRVNRWN